MTLRCPGCGSEKTEVTDSRQDNINAGRWRRRQCGTCEKRFSTVELVVDDKGSEVRKTSNARWPLFEKRMERLEEDFRKLKDSYRKYKKQHSEDVLDYDRLDRMLKEGTAADD